MENQTDASQKKGHDKHCCVPFCTSNGRRDKNLSFHRFPQQQQRRDAWIQAIRRDPGPLFNIGSETVVCSVHFKSEDFKWTPVKKTLKTESVPSIFQWSKEVTPRRPLVRQSIPTKKQKLDFGETVTLEVEDLACAFDEIKGDHEKPVHVQPSEDDRVRTLELSLKEKEAEIEKLKEKIELERFGVFRFSRDNSLIQFYTGFMTYSIFLSFFEYVKPSASSMTSYYYKSSDVVNLSVGRQRSMLLIDELFMFLVRLKCGFLEQDLAVRFNCHLSTVSRKLITWANFLYFVLGSINIWPSKEKIYENMPTIFKTLHPNTRVIVDCTEVKTERPSSLALGSKIYSNYKGTYTWKGLVGIAPHGALTFVSCLFSGSMSDVEITKLCGIVELLEVGDSVMADKGFVLNKVLEGTGVQVNTPPFLMSHGQFTKQEVEETQTIAKLRIHVERHIKRVKDFHLFDGVVPLSMTGSVNQLWTVANMLTLFKGPLVKDWQ